MFKQVIKSLSKSVQRPAVSADLADSKAKTAVAKGKAKAPEASPAIQKLVAAAVIAPPPQERSPEELCGIDLKMSKDQIRDRLKLLYRRYNRAASSLDAETRSEANSMLDAIVAVREKVFGAI